MLYLLLAFVIERANILSSWPNYGSPYCGLGTIDNVNKRIAQAPMAYRVLFPWLIGTIERICPALKPYRLSVYEFLKYLSILYALLCTALALHDSAALAVCAMLPCTFAYDYFDWPFELAAFALALHGAFVPALLGAVLCASARETAPLSALTYFLVTLDLVGALRILCAVVIVMGLIRAYVGPRKLYCDRWMFRRNLRELREKLSAEPIGMNRFLASPLLSLVVIAVVVTGRAGSAWPVPLIVIGLGWFMALAVETRVFTPVLLWIALGAVGHV